MFPRVSRAQCIRFVERDCDVSRSCRPHRAAPRPRRKASHDALNSIRPDALETARITPQGAPPCKDAGAPWDLPLTAHPCARRDQGFFGVSGLLLGASLLHDAHGLNGPPPLSGRGSSAPARSGCCARCSNRAPRRRRRRGRARRGRVARRAGRSRRAVAALLARSPRDHLGAPALGGVGGPRRRRGARRSRAAAPRSSGRRACASRTCRARTPTASNGSA
jgi:hypothetical protein